MSRPKSKADESRSCCDVVFVLAVAAACLGQLQGVDAGGCGCPPLWTAFGDSCYRYISVRNISWSAAEMYCRGFTVPCTELGDVRIGHLASVHSQEEMDFLGALYDSVRNKRVNFPPRVWIGLHDRGEEGTWEWSDHTPLDFTYWGDNQPNDHALPGQQDCASFMIEWDFAWNDFSCSAPGVGLVVESFMCKMPKW